MFLISNYILGWTSSGHIWNSQLFLSEQVLYNRKVRENQNRATSISSTMKNDLWNRLGARAYMLHKMHNLYGFRIVDPICKRMLYVLRRSERYSRVHLITAQIRRQLCTATNNKEMGWFPSLVRISHRETTYDSVRNVNWLWWREISLGCTQWYRSETI